MPELPCTPDRLLDPAFHIKCVTDFQHKQKPCTIRDHTIARTIDHTIAHTIAHTIDHKRPSQITRDHQRLSHPSNTTRDHHGSVRDYQYQSGSIRNHQRSSRKIKGVQAHYILVFGQTTFVGKVIPTNFVGMVYFDKNLALCTAQPQLILSKTEEFFLEQC